MATPGPRSARLLQNISEDLANDLASIPYASASVVVTAYRRDQIAHPLNGFGFVVPFVEKRKILASSFASVKFSGRAPDDCVLLRTFVGGACQPEFAELPDEELVALVRNELGEIIGASGSPMLTRIARWRGAMPQYHVGHLELVRRISDQANRLPNFELAGNAYDGVGIPFCVRSGEQAAERLLGISSEDDRDNVNRS
ncbi:MAG: protoporphyrinogen oxidase, partial [Planctomycetes bacterium]|nr:protoporphyrinogen oxidase [Planctomycetota bacterium]